MNFSLGGILRTVVRWARAGLTGVPYDSGGSRREQDISKAGNKRIRRAMTIELAWGGFLFKEYRKKPLSGSPGRTRTYNPSVNSRMLYH